MSTVPHNNANVTVTAHQSHWYDVLERVLLTIGQTNNVLAKFVPASVEQGITIATTLGPAVIESAKGNN